MSIKTLQRLYLLLKTATIWIIQKISRKPFTGVWATFEFLDDTCLAIESLKKEGIYKITTHSPCARKELKHALNESDSRVPYFSLVFAIIGAISAFVVITWMSLEWVLPVSSKPVVSFYPIIIIGFELTIFFGSIGTVLGMAGLGLIKQRRTMLPRSVFYKNYNRFSQDRFGVVVSCESAESSGVIEIFRKFSAEEIHNEC